MPDKISLAIQAGGNFRRMGEDKGLKLFLDRPLIQRVVERISTVGDEILITTNHPADYAFLKLRLVQDLIPDCGAFGGIYTALAAASFPMVAVVACDMPFASAALLKAAITLLVQEEVDVVIPRSIAGLEPMHAIYRRSTCLPSVLAAIQAGQLKISDWLSSVRVRELSLQEAVAVEPAGLAFMNVNSPMEFLGAEILARSSQDR
ncbi:MAG: molybdenum cofactor guanylyltransferase [Anaerolineales bacterium]|jgi:molybdopterin-guanine dinucleotide biosynthesis protein A